MNKIIGFNDKTDLTLSKDSASVVVFNKDKRNAKFILIIPLYFFCPLYFFWLYFFSEKGINWTQEGDVVFFLGVIMMISIILVMIILRHKITFNIPEQKYYEEVGIYPFSMKRMSGKFENISIELVTEKI